MKLVCMAAEEDSFRDKVVASTTQLQSQLLEAVERLQRRRPNSFNIPVGGDTQLPIPATRFAEQSSVHIATPSSRSVSQAPRLSGQLTPQQPIVPLVRQQTGDLSIQRQTLKRSSFNFNPTGRTSMKRRSANKARKLPTWTHTFVCLSSPLQSFVPDSDERGILQLAGLGEKRISFLAEGGSYEIYSELQYQFPKLKDGGGFEMLRVDGGSRTLQVIAMPEKGYTVPYLRAVVHHAKIYLRPLQKELSTEQDQELGTFDEPVTEKCLNCGNSISIGLLREHIESCQSPSINSPSINSPSINSPSINSPSIDSPSTDSPSIDSPSIDLRQPSSSTPIAISEDMNNECLNNSQEIINIEDDQEAKSDIGETENALVEYAKNLSQDDSTSSNKVESMSPFKSIEDLINSLRKHLVEETFEFILNRSTVVKDALKRTLKPTFSWRKKIEVSFIGEFGADGGGLTREFFTIFGKNILNYFEYTGTFRHNSVALQDNVFFRLGQLASMSFLQGGAGLHWFCTSVYNYISGVKVNDIIVDISEVPDYEVKEKLHQVSGMKSNEELRSFVGTHYELLSDSGFVKPSTCIAMEDKVEIVQAVGLHFVILRSKAELDQFIEGLDACEILLPIRANSALAKNYFTIEGRPQLTTDVILKMFRTIKYSPHGSNDKKKEEATFGFFVDYLDECEQESFKCRSSTLEILGSPDEPSPVTLETVMYFFSGATEIPPIGYGPYGSPCVKFNFDQPYPTASTCAIELTLPAKYHEYSLFKGAMDTAMVCHGGFGVA